MMAKKIIILLVAAAAVLFAPMTFAGEYEIYPVRVIDAKTIAASGDYTSAAVNLRRVMPTQGDTVAALMVSKGIFTIHASATGSGSVNCEYLLYNTASELYAAPLSGGSIGTVVGGTNNVIDFEMELTTAVKIKCTETAAAAIVLTVDLLTQ